jgi:hypothetical protein
VATTKSSCAIETSISSSLKLMRSPISLLSTTGPRSKTLLQLISTLQIKDFSNKNLALSFLSFTLSNTTSSKKNSWSALSSITLKLSSLSYSPIPWAWSRSTLQWPETYLNSNPMDQLILDACTLNRSESTIMTMISTLMVSKGYSKLMINKPHFLSKSNRSPWKLITSFKKGLCKRLMNCLRPQSKLSDTQSKFPKSLPSIEPNKTYLRSKSLQLILMSTIKSKAALYRATGTNIQKISTKTCSSFTKNLKLLMFFWLSWPKARGKTSCWDSLN